VPDSLADKLLDEDAMGRKAPDLLQFVLKKDKSLTKSESSKAVSGENKEAQEILNIQLSSIKLDHEEEEIPLAVPYERKNFKNLPKILRDVSKVFQKSKGGSQLALTMLDMLIFAASVARESPPVRETVEGLMPLEVILKLLFTFQTKEIAVKCLRLIGHLYELGM